MTAQVMGLSLADLVGSTGVAILLGAFALNLARRLDPGGAAYQGANALGAGLAATAAWMIAYWPFVVLEGVWCLVSLVALTRTAAAAREASRVA